MKSPPVLSSPTFAAVAVFGVLSSSTTTRGAPTGPSPLRSSISSPAPSDSPSTYNSPRAARPASYSARAGLEEYEPPVITEDAAAFSGLGITIPLSKPEAYLRKRAEPVVDFAWLLQNKANVVRKFAGSINPLSPHYDPGMMTPVGTGGEDMAVEETIQKVETVISVIPSILATPKLGDAGAASPTSSPALASPSPSSSSSVSSPASAAAFTPVPNSSSSAAPSPAAASSTPVTSSPLVFSSSHPAITTAVTSSTAPSSSVVATRNQKRQNEVLSDQGSLWMGPLTIGGQEFQVDFDTGSADLWIPNVQCSKDGCVGHKKYSVSRQAKAKSGSFSISYGDGSGTSGPIYTDNASIAGLSFTNQTFSPVTQMSSSFSNDGGSGYPADGIAGMGFPSLSQMRAPPFFQNLASQNKKLASVFCFRLNAARAELYLGGINPKQYTGSITYAAVTQQTYWTINMDALAVGSSTVAVQGKKAIIDTGTTLVYGSDDDVDAVFRAIPGSKDMAASYGADYQGYHTFPCSSSPTVSFAFGGKYFSIGSKAFNLGKVAAGSKDCVAAVVGQDPKASGLGNTWLVGDSFLVGTYAIFDVGNSRVGFATPVA